MAEKNKGGRPTKFKPEYTEQALHLCRLGATTLDLAHAFKVTSKTIETWMKQYPEFLRTIKEAKSNADDKVKQALYHRALGYSHPDTKFATFEGKITDSEEYTRHYPPDTTACMAWLHNRDPEHWKPRKAAEVSDAVESIAESLAAIAEKIED